MLLFLISVMSIAASAQDSVRTSSEKNTAVRKQAFTVQTAQVHISSEPAGATVYIADEEIGVTPVSFEYPSGRHLISLSYDNFPDIEEIIVIKPPETKKTYIFKDARSILSISTFKKARVYVNGEMIKDFENIKLHPGEYNIKVEMDSAKTMEKNVVLADKESKTLLLYPDYPSGSVQVDVKPDGAFIELWEEGVEKYTSTGSKIFNRLPVGVYNLKASKKGYKSQDSKISLQAGKVEKVKFKLIKGSSVGGEYVLVEGGSFMMGGDGCSDEKPLHLVNLKSFYISRYETTQAEWNFVMNGNNCEFKGDSLPVENVSWFDAISYCNRLSEIEGLQKCYSGTGNDITYDFKANGYRLPTEAEWEYAAAGGKNDIKSIFSGSNFISEVGIFAGNSRDSTNAIGHLKPNELGIHDMTGNVSEWCWDWYDVYPDNVKMTDPSGPKKGFLKVIRGGSWYNYDKCSRICCRNLYNPNESHFYLGFRVAKNK